MKALEQMMQKIVKRTESAKHAVMRVAEVCHALSLGAAESFFREELMKWGVW